MSALLKNTTNSIWHAFFALQHNKNGLVHKSKLKVLTANIGTLLDLYAVEKGLDHYRSTTFLNFENFIYYLDREVFSSLPDKLPLSQLRNYEAKIDEVCWLVCHRKYISRDKKIIPENSVFKIFRIFCLLADLVSNEQDATIFEALLHISEARPLCEHLVQHLGLTWEDSDWNKITYSINALPFSMFLAVLESRYCGEGALDETPIVEAIDEIYQLYILDVIKKGHLFKRGYLLHSTKEYWFVLRPHELCYHKGSNEKELFGTITLDPTCSVAPICGKTNEKTTHKPERIQRMNLTTSERIFELGAQDHKTRLQWLAALQLAITYSNGNTGYQRSMSMMRRHQRELDNKQELLKKSEEAKKNATHIQEIQETRAQLLNEKIAREAAEIQARHLQAVAKEESQKVLKMEDARLNLERLLEQETQAKRDEEIVRALQARVLAAEWEKREELEKLQEEQKCLLEEERKKRQQFEQIQSEKEEQLKEAENKLKELETEREKLDSELKSARTKIISSEEEKEVLESQLRVISPSKRSIDRARRTVSLMPSMEDVSADLKERSSTLRRMKKTDANT